MGNINFSDLLSKADKMATLSVFDDIIAFIKDIKPSLDTINSSIQENIKKMPQATKKISKVTEATEIATTEILNVLDGIFPKIELIIKIISEQYSKSRSNTDLTYNLLKNLQKAITSKIDLNTILPDLNLAIQSIEIEQQNPISTIEIDDILQSITMDATSIMMSLQVQDITSQQLAAVKHLLDSIQGRLSGILEKFETSDIQNLIGKTDGTFSKEKNETEMHRKIAFDPNAVDAFDKSLNRQELVDDLFENHDFSDDDESSISSTSTDEELPEIDNSSLEENNSADEAKFIELNENDNPEENHSEPVETSMDEPVDQNDIDALFNSSAFDDVEDDGPVSQDDIDKLFG